MYHQVYSAHNAQPTAIISKCSKSPQPLPQRSSNSVYILWEYLRAGNSLIGFLSKLLVFSEKICDLGDSLVEKKTYKKVQKINFTIIVKFFSANRSFTHLSWATWGNRSRTLICHERPDQFTHSRSLTWGTWAIRSQSLICPERSEQIAHSRSFDLSDLSKWANERWANEQIPSPGISSQKRLVKSF